jgi:hypothetical protein
MNSRDFLPLLETALVLDDHDVEPVFCQAHLLGQQSRIAFVWLGQYMTCMPRLEALDQQILATERD